MGRREGVADAGAIEVPGFDRGRAFRVFEQALGMDEPSRVRFMDENCSDTDTALRAEVESLLEAARKHQPRTSVLLPALSRATENLIGECFGHFRLIEFVGEGDMGVVYRAERIDGISQVVAIKLIANELGERGRERFLRETQLLARLEHPAIARLIDAGVEAGRAWIALEFVPGRPIDAYCDDHQLPLRACVQLLVNLARAVAAAHGFLVVHGDIKPANVLVTADGSPKLIDFGIAAVLQDHGAAHSQTADIGRLFTPHYAAPEQTQGVPLTVATDVYGLGALAYRLLTGVPTYRACVEPLRYMMMVIAQNVELPSRAALAATPDALSRAAKLRVEALRGDLDAILCKALERDPARRYSSAKDVQEDLNRYLMHRPVLARAQTISYRFGKFVLRNTLAVALMGLLLASLMTAGTLIAWQARRVAVAREMAIRRGEFLENLLKSANPDWPTRCLRGHPIGRRVSRTRRRSRQGAAGRGLDAGTHCSDQHRSQPLSRRVGGQRQASGDPNQVRGK